MLRSRITRFTLFIAALLWVTTQVSAQPSSNASPADARETPKTYRQLLDFYQSTVDEAVAAANEPGFFDNPSHDSVRTLARLEIAAKSLESILTEEEYQLNQRRYRIESAIRSAKYGADHVRRLVDKLKKELADGLVTSSRGHAVSELKPILLISDHTQRSEKLRVWSAKWHQPSSLARLSRGGLSANAIIGHNQFPGRASQLDLIREVAELEEPTRYNMRDYYEWLRRDIALLDQYVPSEWMRLQTTVNRRLVAVNQQKVRVEKVLKSYRKRWLKLSSYSQNPHSNYLSEILHRDGLKAQRSSTYQGHHIRVAVPVPTTSRYIDFPEIKVDSFTYRLSLEQSLTLEPPFYASEIAGVGKLWCNPIWKSTSTSMGYYETIGRLGNWCLKLRPTDKIDYPTYDEHLPILKHALETHFDLSKLPQLDRRYQLLPSEIRKIAGTQSDSSETKSDRSRLTRAEAASIADSFAAARLKVSHFKKRYRREDDQIREFKKYVNYKESDRIARVRRAVENFDKELSNLHHSIRQKTAEMEELVRFREVVELDISQLRIWQNAAENRDRTIGTLRGSRGQPALFGEQQAIRWSIDRLRTYLRMPSVKSRQEMIRRLATQLGRACDYLDFKQSRLSIVEDARTELSAELTRPGHLKSLIEDWERRRELEKEQLAECELTFERCRAAFVNRYREIAQALFQTLSTAPAEQRARGSFLRVSDVDFELYLPKEPEFPVPPFYAVELCAGSYVWSEKNGNRIFIKTNGCVWRLQALDETNQLDGVFTRTVANRLQAVN